MSAPGSRGVRGVIPIMLAAVASAAVAGVAVYLQAATELRAATDDKVTALMQVRRDALRDYLNSVLEETRFWNKNRVMRAALVEFSGAWKELPEPRDHPAETLYRRQPLSDRREGQPGVRHGWLHL